MAPQMTSWTHSLLALAVLLVCMQSTAACLLRVRQNADPEVLLPLPSGEHSGPQVEIVREAARRIGCRVQILHLPWARALIELQAGRLDVLPDAQRTPEREVFARFSAGAWLSRNGVFMRTSDLRAQGAPASLEDFAARRLRLGVQVGVLYGASTDRLLADQRLAALLVRAPSRKSLWNMLALGRVDGVIADESGGRRELHMLGLDHQLSLSAIPLEAEASYTAFSRATVTPELLARFDAALEAMRRDGSFVAIERRFKKVRRRPSKAQAKLRPALEWPRVAQPPAA